MAKPFQPTKLRELYNALGLLNEEEQIKLAQLHAEKPKHLFDRLAHSLVTVSSYPPLAEEFVGEVRVDLPDPPTPLPEVKTTPEFVSHLANGQRRAVIDGDELSFRYVAREVSPLRTNKPKGPRPSRRSLDLLLVNDEGRPIAAELKIRTDKPSYYAFVQALMYAAELSSASQQERLVERYRDARLLRQIEGPVIDVYLIAFEPPSSGEYRDDFDKATEQISEKLVHDPRFSTVIGRIAHIEASIDGDELVFAKRFAFGSGIGQ